MMMGPYGYGYYGYPPGAAYQQVQIIPGFGTRSMQHSHMLTSPAQSQTMMMFIYRVKSL